MAVLVSQARVRHTTNNQQQSTGNVRMSCWVAGREARHARLRTEPPTDPWVTDRLHRVAPLLPPHTPARTTRTPLSDGDVGLYPQAPIHNELLPHGDIQCCRCHEKSAPPVTGAHAHRLARKLLFQW